MIRLTRFKPLSICITLRYTTRRVNAIHLGPCVTYNENVLQTYKQGIPDWIEKGDKVRRPEEMGYSKW